MGKRWALFLLLVIVLAPFFAHNVESHKWPVIEYTYVSDIWEESYKTIPRQPVIGEQIGIIASVVHPSETIEGNVTGLISIYRDDTVYEWYGGKSYERPNWLLIKEVPLQPTENHNEFESDVVITEPGSYHVFIDWYESRQYIGQSMHTLDVEQRTLGPLFLWFSAIIVILVCLGVYLGIL